MDLTKTVSFDQGNIYTYRSVNIDTGPEWLVKMNGNVKIIACIDVTGRYITYTPSCPQISNIDMLNISLIMAIIGEQYKQLQTN